MNRRRMLIGVAGSGLLASCLLLLPALGPSAEPVSARDPLAAAQPAESPAPAEPPAKPTPPPATKVAPRPRVSQTAPSMPDVDPHLAFGSKTAPITMEVFSDFQCPACRSLYLGTWQQLLDNYVNSDKVYLIHRNFPLPGHAYSRVAARYATAAARLGKFEPVERALFDKQTSWEQSGDVDGTVAAVLSATEMTKVRALVKGGTLDAEIDRDTTLGQGYHITQTPTSVIHAKGQTYPVVGVVSYPVLKQFLDQLLGS